MWDAAGAKTEFFRKCGPTLGILGFDVSSRHPGNGDPEGPGGLEKPINALFPDFFLIFRSGTGKEGLR